MISVLILYPRSDDSTFDMDYYTTKHMPMFAEALGEACTGWGVSAPAAKYHAVGWVTVESQDAFNATMAEHGAKVIGDVPNYTNVQPELVTGDVVV
jgi:uncharacterized protein (TIGR02118 family)